MITKEILQERYGSRVMVENCIDCENEMKVEVKIVKRGRRFQVNIASPEIASSLLSYASEKGLLNNLNKDGALLSLMTRCVCFQVTDENGTRTECFLCQEPPDVRCSGPFPYCPSNMVSLDLDDDSRNFVRVAQVYVPNSVCSVGQWATMLNGHPNRFIRVYYDLYINGFPQPRVCLAHPTSSIPDPNDYGTLLGCWGDYRITNSEYI